MWKVDSALRDKLLVFGSSGHSQREVPTLPSRLQMHFSLQMCGEVELKDSLLWCPETQDYRRMPRLACATLRVNTVSYACHQWSVILTTTLSGNPCFLHVKVQKRVFLRINKIVKCWYFSLWKTVHLSACHFGLDYIFRNLVQDLEMWYAFTKIKK